MGLWEPCVRPLGGTKVAKQDEPLGDFGATRMEEL